MIKQFFKKYNYRHLISVIITVSFLVLSVTVFSSSFIRIAESLRDVGRSFAYYVQEIFFFDWGIAPSVTALSKVPFTPIFNLPTTWEEFTLRWSEFWTLFVSKENIVLYFNSVSDTLFYISKYFLLLGVPVILLFVLLFKRYLNKKNNDYNKDSKPLKIFKKFLVKVYRPVKYWIKSYIGFLKQNKFWLYTWLGIWLWNFNVITIVIEFIAYYLYFVSSFDTASIYVQIYKLFSDLSVVINFIPVIGWVLIGYVILCIVRKKIGYARLNHNERKNCGCINERPIVLMVCGTMGKKKTTIITDMALSEEVLLREKAFEKLLENDLKFPNFPWINLEKNLQKAMYHHRIYNLATIDRYISKLARLFHIAHEHPELERYIFRHLRRHFNYNFDIYFSLQ